MKTIIKDTLITLFVVLVAGNIYIFVRGMYLSDNLNRFQDQIQQLQTDNDHLRTQVYQAESLQYASSISAVLKFTKKSQPLFFEQLKYALKR